MHYQSLIEGLKESARVAFLAGAVVAGDALGSGGTINWRLVLVAAVIALLKGSDRYVHKNPEIEAKGLLPW